MTRARTARRRAMIAGATAAVLAGGLALSFGLAHAQDYVSYASYDEVPEGQAFQVPEPCPRGVWYQDYVAPIMDYENNVQVPFYVNWWQYIRDIVGRDGLPLPGSSYYRPYLTPYATAEGYQYTWGAAYVRALCQWWGIRGVIELHSVTFYDPEGYADRLGPSAGPSGGGGGDDETSGSGDSSGSSSEEFCVEWSVSRGGVIVDSGTTCDN